MSSLDEARSFATRYNFHVGTDVLTFTLPQKLNKTQGVYRKDDWLFMSFAYEPVRVRLVKGISGVTWDPESKAWRAPLTAIRQVINWATTFDEYLPEEISKLAEDIEQQRGLHVDWSVC